jgi:hypothetical protein
MWLIRILFSAKLGGYLPKEAMQPSPRQIASASAGSHTLASFLQAGCRDY